MCHEMHSGGVKQDVSLQILQIPNRRHRILGGFWGQSLRSTDFDWRLFGVVLRTPTGGFGSSKFFKRPMTNFHPRTLLGRSRTARVGARASRVVRVLRLAGEPGAIPGVWPWVGHFKHPELREVLVVTTMHPEPLTMELWNCGLE